MRKPLPDGALLPEELPLLHLHKRPEEEDEEEYDTDKHDEVKQNLVPEMNSDGHQPIFCRYRLSVSLYARKFIVLKQKMVASYPK